jgi:hypothetical protein
MRAVDRCLHPDIGSSDLFLRSHIRTYPNRPRIDTFAPSIMFIPLYTECRWDMPFLVVSAGEPNLSDLLYDPPRPFEMLDEHA